RKVTEVGWYDDQASRKVRTQLIKVRQFFGMIVVCIAEDEAVTVRKCDVFCTPNDGGEKRIGNVGNHHSDYVRLVAAQSARKLAGLIANRLNGIKHPFP